MIKKWHFKALVQKVISYLPYKTKVNLLFQRALGNVKLSDQMFTYKITHAADHLRFFKERNKTNHPVALELGTGWYPIVPISLYLSGFEKIISVDVNQWLSEENIFTTIEKFIEWDKQGKLQQYLKDIDPERWKALLSILDIKKDTFPEELCQQFNFYPQVTDARNLSIITNNSIDFICSNNTFEHIDPDILKAILQEFKRVLKKDGVMSHHIDMTDHFSHFDHSISPYNFLKYSDLKWRIINNALGFQNRLRYCDYEDLYSSMAITFEEKNIIKGSLEQDERNKFADKYQNYSTQDLSVTGGYLITLN